MHPLGQPNNGCHMPTCYSRCKPCDLVGEIVAQAFWTPPLVLCGVVASHDFEALLQMSKNLLINVSEEE
jgi:hypothetical protein